MHGQVHTDALETCDSEIVGLGSLSHPGVAARVEQKLAGGLDAQDVLLLEAEHHVRRVLLLA